MVGPPNKRQKREEYEKTVAASTPVGAGGSNARNDASVAAAAEKKKLELPKKKFYRQRAHANVFSDHALIYPNAPENMNWASHYPSFVSPESETETSDIKNLSISAPGRSKALTKQVEIADIGCGFGGLLVALSPVFPDTLMVGMEIRNQVLNYVTSRISALRSQHADDPLPTPETPALYTNISAIRTNSMKFLPQYFPRASLSKIFLCFPDPHFKQRKHKARIVSRSLCAEYAYVLKRGTGMVYTITDVEELGAWMARCFDGPKNKKKSNQTSNDGEPNGNEDQTPAEEEEEEEEDDDPEDASNGVEELFERVPEEELANDPSVRIMSEETEEAKKVTRNGGKKYIGVWRRKADPAWV